MAIHFIFIYAIISQRHHIWQELEKENKKAAQYAGYLDQIQSPVIDLICPTLYWSHVYAHQLQETVQQKSTTTLNYYSIWLFLMYSFGRYTVLTAMQIEFCTSNVRVILRADLGANKEA